MCSWNTSLGSLSPKSWPVHALVVLVDVVDALEEVRDPADAAFGQRDLQVGELPQHRRPDQVGRAPARCSSACSVISTSIGASARRASTSCDDEPMCRHTTVPVVAARRPERVPVVGVEARAARASAGFSENVTAWQPFVGDPVDLGGHQRRVPDRRERQRDEAAGVGAAPLVDVPVVVAPAAARARGPCRRARRTAGRRSCGNDGKHIEPSTPLTFMSRTRSWMS